MILFMLCTAMSKLTQTTNKSIITFQHTVRYFIICTDRAHVNMLRPADCPQSISTATRTHPESPRNGLESPALLDSDFTRILRCAIGLWATYGTFKRLNDIFTSILFIA